MVKAGVGEGACAHRKQYVDNGSHNAVPVDSVHASDVVVIDGLPMPVDTNEWHTNNRVLTYRMSCRAIPMASVSEIVCAWRMLSCGPGVSESFE